MNFNIVIPARYASSRLPGKPLLDIVGKPMILHVIDRAMESGANEVCVATDDARIFKTVESVGCHVCMTSDHHTSGTERIEEVVNHCGWPDDAIVVNLQGDEPLLPPTLLHQVASDLDRFSDAGMSTLMVEIDHIKDVFDPNVVKVVTDQQGYALYFSRAVIPWHRDGFMESQSSIPDNTHFYRHIGLYGYRAEFLRQYVKWPASPLESIESLEQLRVLYMGSRIHVSKIDELPGHGVDTAEDLARVEKILGFR